MLVLVWEWGQLIVEPQAHGLLQIMFPQQEQLVLSAQTAQLGTSPAFNLKSALKQQRLTGGRMGLS